MRHNDGEVEAANEAAHTGEEIKGWLSAECAWICPVGNGWVSKVTTRCSPFWARPSRHAALARPARHKRPARPARTTYIGARQCSVCGSMDLVGRDAGAGGEVRRPNMGPPKNGWQRESERVKL